MHYDDLVDLLVEKIKSLDYVKDFQQAETALMANQELFKAQEEMKALQKEAVLYQKIDNWWINEIEIPTSADEIPVDYNRDQVFSGQAFILSAINDIILLNGSDNYSEILKLFRKML